MKKKMCIVFVFIFLCNFVYSQEENNQNWSFNISPLAINLFDFDEDAFASDEELAIFSTMLSFSFGFGYHLNLIQNIAAPGLYIDMGIGYLGILLGTDEEGESLIFGGWAGIRLYNRFRLNLVDIEPFFGFTLYGFNNTGLFTANYGLLIAFSYYGVEYSFHQPINNASKIYYAHRITFLLHLR